MCRVCRHPDSWPTRELPSGWTDNHMAQNLARMHDAAYPHLAPKRETSGWRHRQQKQQQQCSCCKAMEHPRWREIFGKENIRKLDREGRNFTKGKQDFLQTTFTLLKCLHIITLLQELDTVGVRYLRIWDLGAVAADAYPESCHSVRSIQVGCLEIVPEEVKRDTATSSCSDENNLLTPRARPADDGQWPLAASSEPLGQKRQETSGSKR